VLARPDAKVWYVDNMAPLVGRPSEVVIQRDRTTWHQIAQVQRAKHVGQPDALDDERQGIMRRPYEALVVWLAPETVYDVLDPDLGHCATKSGDPPKGIAVLDDDLGTMPSAK